MKMKKPKNNTRESSLPRRKGKTGEVPLNPQNHPFNWRALWNRSREMRREITMWITVSCLGGLNLGLQDFS